MKKLTKIFADAEVPAMICIASEGGADTEELKLSSLSDTTTGSPLTVISNLDDPKSPFTGEPIKNETTKEVETASSPTKGTLAALAAIAHCVECAHDTYVAKEFAAELDNHEFHCTNCGEMVTAFYDADLVEADVDEDEDGDDGDDSADVTDALNEDTDDEDDEDSDDDDSDMTDGDSDSTTTDGDDTVADPKTATDDEDTTTDDDTDADSTTTDSTDADTVDTDTTDGDDADATDADTDDNADAGDESGESDDDDDSEDETASATESPTESPTEKPAPVVEENPAPNPKKDVKDETATTETADTTTVDAPVVEVEEIPATHADVVIATVVNYDNESIKLASLSDTSRYEVFLGHNHIGSLLRDQAATQVQTAFAKSDFMRNAFSTAFFKVQTEVASGKFDALKDFGFQPTIHKVALDKVVASEIQKATDALQATVDEKISDASDQVVATIQIAMAGIQKGVLDGPNFTTELSALLSTHGVKHSDDVALRFVERQTDPFFKAVVANAEKLRSETPDYVRGLATMIEKASYTPPKTKKTAEDSPYLATSATLPRHEQERSVAPARVVETANVKPASTNNPYKGVFARMGGRKS